MALRQETPELGPSTVLRGCPVLVVTLAGRTLLGLRRALERAGAPAVFVSDLRTARGEAAKHRPRVSVVIDLPNDVTAVRDALAGFRDAEAVLLLTGRVTKVDRSLLLNAGADHVLDTEDPGEVLECLAAVLRRSRSQRSAVELEVLRIGDLCLDLTTRAVTSAGRPIALTALEFDLLAYFMTRAGRTLSRERLLTDVWGYGIGDLGTVTVHVRRLRTKIETDPSQPLLLGTVRGIGYRFRRGDELGGPQLGVAHDDDSVDTSSMSC